VAFAATGAEGKKGNKKKEITCYKCKKRAIMLMSVTTQRDHD